MLTDPEEDYARGFVPFLDCTIYLDSHPLIPRSETEYWIEKAIAEIKKTPSPKCLDLFAGSGAIGVAVLKHVPDSRVDFGEIDAAHLPTIEKNIVENGIDPTRTNILETDVFSGVSVPYDFILANPPYIARERENHVQDSVLIHEPHAALFADDEGFALIEKTIRGAKSHLAPGGRVFIEHEPEHTEKLSKLAGEIGLSLRNEKDQYGVHRYSVFMA